MILRRIPHFIEIERKQLPPRLGITPLNSGIRYPSVTSIENTFLSGMQSSESSFIVTSAVSSTEDRSENQESSILGIGRSFNWRFGFRDVPFGLSLLFSHRPGDNTARTKILDWTPCRNSQQLDRLCNWIANVTAWLYSREPVCIGVYAFSMRSWLKERTHANRDQGAATEIADRTYPYWCASKRAAIVTQQIINLKLTSATKIELPEEHHAC
jgi:hypothetical protein